MFAVGRLVRFKSIVRSEMIQEVSFDNKFCYFRYVLTDKEAIVITQIFFKK